MERRRLPLLNQTPPPENEVEGTPRPPLHWVGFGTVAIFAAWLPLAYIAGAISKRVMMARFGADASQDEITLAMSDMSGAERARLMTLVALPTVLCRALAARGVGL